MDKHPLAKLTDKFTDKYNVNFNSNIKYINNNNNTVINNDSISENPNAQKRNFKFTFKILPTIFCVEGILFHF